MTLFTIVTHRSQNVVVETADWKRKLRYLTGSYMLFCGGFNWFTKYDKNDHILYQGQPILIFTHDNLTFYYRGPTVMI